MTFVTDDIHARPFPRLDTHSFPEGKDTGETTDLRTLPEGTEFSVVNGGWLGEVVIRNGVRGVLVKDLNKVVPITEENANALVLDIVGKPSQPKALTPELIEGLNLMLKGGHITDSDIEDFCCENDLSRKEVFHYVAVAGAPDRCKRCRHVEMYPSMSPCVTCKRRYDTDYFEEDI